MKFTLHWQGSITMYSQPPVPGPEPGPIPPPSGIEVDRVPLEISPQLRSIPPSSTVNIVIAVPEKKRQVIITSKDIVTFCEQADQDLLTYFSVSNKVYYQSGLMKPTKTSFPFDKPLPTFETRVEATSGGPYNRVAINNDNAIPDNFEGQDKHIVILVPEKQVLFFAITNQSDVYEHSVMVDIKGYYIEL